MRTIDRKREVCKLALIGNHERIEEIVERFGTLEDKTVKLATEFCDLERCLQFALKVTCPSMFDKADSKLKTPQVSEGLQEYDIHKLYFMSLNIPLEDVREIAKLESRNELTMWSYSQYSIHGQYTQE